MQKIPDECSSSPHARRFFTFGHLALAVFVEANEVVRNEELWTKAATGHFMGAVTRPAYVKDELPEGISWASINGTSYLSPVRNQHIPGYFHFFFLALLKHFLREQFRPLLSLTRWLGGGGGPPTG